MAAFLMAVTACLASSQQRAAVTVDLKPLGIAPDLFTDQSDSRYQQRGVINVFWIGNDRVVAAFSTTHRWSSTEKPEPLKVRLLVFSSSGKQLNERSWSFSEEGPDGAMTLDLEPGPDDSIVALFDAHSAGKIPDGDYVQVLNPDTTLRQNFYVPATSSWVPSVAPEPGLVLQSYFANRQSSFTWWSGKPLKPGTKLDLPAGEEETLAGPPGLAARANCAAPTLCFNVRIYRRDLAIWSYSSQDPELVPKPLAFLGPAALLVELRNHDEKKTGMVITHPTGAPTPLPAIPHAQQVLGATGVSRDGIRFAVNVAGEAGICGGFSIWCNQRSQAVVIDVPGNKIVLQQEISAAGGTSSLSPDGMHLAVLDKSKLFIYSLP